MSIAPTRGVQPSFSSGFTCKFRNTKNAADTPTARRRRVRKRGESVGRSGRKRVERTERRKRVITSPKAEAMGGATLSGARKSLVVYFER
jgi:hypothetical protein